jgi:hypothetical protein
MSEQERYPFPGSGSLIFWKDQEPGATYEGTFVGEHHGPYGYHYDLKDELTDEIVTLTSATVLDKQMAHLSIGAYATVEFHGRVPSKRPGSGPFFSFTVSAGKASDWLKHPRRDVNGAKV